MRNTSLQSHNSREQKTTPSKKGNRNGKQTREAKRILEELIDMLNSQDRINAKMIKAVEQNKILSKNQKLTGKLTRGMRQEDVTYLKKLAYSLTV